MKTILCLISFSQSKTYKTDWKVRYEYKDGYKTVLITDEISKNTKFGEEPNRELMEAYAVEQARSLATSFGFEVDIEVAK